MYTKQDFIESLKAMGLKETDTVLVHSSFKNVAGDIGVEGGADTIVDSFIEYFGEKGLIIFPAMSWKLGYLIDKNGNHRDPLLGLEDGYYEFGNHFDVRKTPCHGLGIIPEIFRKRPGVVRSICPTSSLCAFGNDASDFCAGHEFAETPLNWNSPWGKLYDRKAKILFLGTTMACNTFMHVLEEKANVPGILRPYIWKYTVTDYNGNTFPVEFKRHEPDHNAYYIKIQQELVDKGIAKEVSFGSALCHLVDVVAETDYMMERFKDNPLLFTHEYNKAIK